MRKLVIQLVRNVQDDEALEGRERKCYMVEVYEGLRRFFTKRRTRSFNE